MEKRFWKKVFIDACLYFAAASTVICIVYLIISEESVYSQLFSVIRLLMLLGFCFVMATANRILLIEKLNGFVKLLLHAGLTFTGFFALIYAPLVADNEYQFGLINKGYEAPNFFIVFAIVAVVYAALYGIYFAVRCKKNNKKNKESEYKSLYKNKK